MSRHEIADLEQLLREIDEPDEFVPDEEIFSSPEYFELKEQMIKMQPIRHGLIKRYIDKVKYQKRKRENLLRLVEKTEEIPKEILGEDYVHYLDAMPEIKQFIEEVRVKESIRQAERDALAGE